MQSSRRLPTSPPKAIKVHQPREDPRLFYLSDAYAKEINEKNLNNEVAGVYPGRDVVRANGHGYYDYHRHNRPMPSRLTDRTLNSINEGNFAIYCQCPCSRSHKIRHNRDRLTMYDKCDRG